MIAHGSDGALRLGNAQLDFSSLLSNANAIRRWGEALTADADIMLYGCDVARTDDGRALVQALAGLTGADVAASSDPTGSVQQGGDWDLEYRTGGIETALAIGTREQSSWSGVLDASAPTAPPPQPDIASVPLTFEQNSGQSDAQVDFLARGKGYGLWLTDGDAVLSVRTADSTHVVRLDVVDANADTIATGENELQARTSYFVGAQDQWRSGIANFGSVLYDDVYDGIDLRY